MLHQFMSQMYEIPIGWVFLAVMLVVSLWTVAAKFFESRKWFGVINIVTLITMSIAVFLITLVLRTHGASGVSLVPFYVFALAREYPDVYNQMVLNIVLFVPLGLSFPYILRKRAKHPVVITLIFALVVSLIIEILQYIFACGYSEVDDLIFNVSGALIGAISYMVFRGLKNKSIQEK